MKAAQRSAHGTVRQALVDAAGAESALARSRQLVARAQAMYVAQRAAVGYVVSNGVYTEERGFEPDPDVVINAKAATASSSAAAAAPAPPPMTQEERVAKRQQAQAEAAERRRKRLRARSVRGRAYAPLIMEEATAMRREAERSLGDWVEDRKSVV